MNKRFPPSSRGSSRRAFLGTAATIITLPYLESLLPRAAWAAPQPSAPKRLLFYWIPNGINGATRAAFWPTTTGASYAITPMLKPLTALKADFSFVTGLENVSAKPDGAGDHASGTSSFLTCVHAQKSETNIKLGISADQVAAAVIGKATKLPSMQIGMDGGSTAGDCDNGYSCAYARNISWADATTPLPKLTKPKDVFNQIFQGADPTATAAEQAKRKLYSKSVLDAATGDAESLRLALGQSDKAKLDEYLTSIREIEQRLDTGADLTCDKGSAPPEGLAFPAAVDTMSDLMVLAMQCDATRIITFMLGNALSSRVHSNLPGVTLGHHTYSHHGGQVDNLAKLQLIGTFEMQLFANLLTKMKAVKEGENDLLYNSAIFLSSDISNGDRHNHDDLPVLLAGHGGGALKPGRHILYDKAAHTRISNLLYTMLGTVGVTTQFGDSTGVLPEL